MKQKKTRQPIPAIGKPKFPSIDELLNNYFERIDKAQAREEQFFKTYYKWLEDQREDRISEILDSLVEAAQTEITGHFNRVVDLRYAHDPLCVAGSVTGAGGRFNIGNGISHYKPFHALYLADTFDTAYAEKFHYARNYQKGNLEGNNFALRGDFASFNVEAGLSRCLDISNKDNLRGFCQIISEIKPSADLLRFAQSVNILHLKTVQSPGELLNTILHPEFLKLPMALDMPANSQWFGLYCLRAGVQAIIYPSVRNSRTGKNIAVLVDNLQDTEGFARLNADMEIVHDSRRLLDQQSLHFFKVPFSKKSTH